jgi:hypothetical protein
MCLRFAFLLITRVTTWLRLARRQETWKTPEILLLRHQLAVPQRRQPRRPNVNRADDPSRHAQEEFLGVPATGRQVRAAAMNHYRFSEGKIVEEWGLPDLFGLMTQLRGAQQPGGAPGV